MAVVVATGTRLELNGVVYTGFVESADLAVDADQIDATNMASGGWKENSGGLKAGTLNLTLQKDYAGGAEDTLLWAQLGNVIPFKLRVTGAAISATNPEYQGSVLINSLKPVPAQVGQKMVAQISFPTSGAVTRAVA
jgi:hypothetical protein